MWAAAEGHGAVVAGLIELGANVKAVSSTGFTPLLFAVIKGDAQSVKALLSAGADPNSATPSGSRPLLVALARNNTAAALALLDAGALTTPVDLMGSSPLHIAAQHGNVAMINALLARKMDPNILTIAPSPGGGGRGRGGAGGRGGGGARGGGGGARDAGPAAQTPLMLAAKADHEDAMRALVAAGANPAIRAEDGSNLLMAAAAGARLKTFTYAFELDPHVDVIAAANKTIMHAAWCRTAARSLRSARSFSSSPIMARRWTSWTMPVCTPIAAADGLPVDQAVDLLTKRSRTGVASRRSPPSVERGSSMSTRGLLFLLLHLGLVAPIVRESPHYLYVSVPGSDLDRS